MNEETLRLLLNSLHQALPMGCRFVLTIQNADKSLNVIADLARKDTRKLLYQANMSLKDEKINPARFKQIAFGVVSNQTRKRKFDLL